MRPVALSEDDCELFHTEIDPFHYSFFRSHADTFKCMWNEQGKKFWLHFLLSYRMFLLKHGYANEFLRDVTLPFCRYKFLKVFEESLINVHKNFIEGRFNSAKRFLQNIVTVAQNRHLLRNVDSISFVNDPFHHKDTRDAFRSLFGVPDFKASLLKVAFSLPLYLKFGGAVCQVLRRWLECNAISISEDSQQANYWQSPSKWHLIENLPSPFETYLESHLKGKFNSITGIHKDAPHFLSLHKDKKLASWNDLCDFDTDCTSDCLCSIICTYHILSAFQTTSDDLKGVCSCSGNLQPFSKCVNSTKGRLGTKEVKCRKNESMQTDEKLSINPIDDSALDKCVNLLSHSPDKKKEDKSNSTDNVKECDASGKHNAQAQTDIIKLQAGRQDSGSQTDSALNGGETIIDGHRTAYVSVTSHASRNIPSLTFPPEIRNYIEQMNKREDTRDRLRKKLDLKRKEYDDYDYFDNGNDCSDDSDDAKPDGELDDPLFKLKLLKMAERKFQEEMTIENKLEACEMQNEKTQPDKYTLKVQDIRAPTDFPVSKSTVAKEITTSSKSTLVTSQGNSLVKAESQLSSEMSKSRSRKKKQLKQGSNGSSQTLDITISKESKADGKEKSRKPHNELSTELQTISRNIDNLELTVQDKGGLDLDDFHLLVQTGKMLMSGKTNATGAQDRHSTVSKDCSKSKLHICAWCHNKEKEAKQFKKCSRCKAESFTEPRFYCCRKCQIQDWEEAHREEHERQGVNTATIT